jgi:hypothetical protein
VSGQKLLFEPPDPRKAFYDFKGPLNGVLYCNMLVHIFRFKPSVAVKTVFPRCLDPERSDAVNLCAIDAILTILIEVILIASCGSPLIDFDFCKARTVSFHTSLDSVYSFAPLIRTLLTVCLLCVFPLINADAASRRVQ